MALTYGNKKTKTVPLHQQPHFGLNNINSGKVHNIHKYNVKIIESDSKPVAYIDHFLDML